jgi:hypothetical protein
LDTFRAEYKLEPAPTPTPEPVPSVVDGYQRIMRFDLDVYIWRGGNAG